MIFPLRPLWPSVLAVGCAQELQCGLHAEQVECPTQSESLQIISSRTEAAGKGSLGPFFCVGGGGGPAGPCLLTLFLPSCDHHTHQGRRTAEKTLSWAPSELASSSRPFWPSHSDLAAHSARSTLHWSWQMPGARFGDSSRLPAFESRHFNGCDVLDDSIERRPWWGSSCVVE